MATTTSINDIIKAFQNHNITLTTLNYNGKGLSDVDVKGIVDKILNDNKLNQSVTALNLRNNKFGPDGVASLMQLKNITTLNIRGNALVGAEGAQILATNKTIKSLYIGGCNIGDVGLEALLSHNSTLTHLDASQNGVTDTGMYALAANNTLISLDLSGNRFQSEEGPEKFVNLFMANETLTSFVPPQPSRISNSWTTKTRSSPFTPLGQLMIDERLHENKVLAVARRDEWIRIVIALARSWYNNNNDNNNAYDHDDGNAYDNSNNDDHDDDDDDDGPSAASSIPAEEVHEEEGMGKKTNPPLLRLPLELLLYILCFSDFDKMGGKTIQQGFACAQFIFETIGKPRADNPIFNKIIERKDASTGSIHFKLSPSFEVTEGDNKDTKLGERLRYYTR